MLPIPVLVLFNHDACAFLVLGMAINPQRSRLLVQVAPGAARSEIIPLPSIYFGSQLVRLGSIRQILFRRIDV